jgi:hypothetical protein
MGCVRLQAEMGKKYISRYNHLEAVKKYKTKNAEKIKSYYQEYYRKNKSPSVECKLYA